MPLDVSHYDSWVPHKRLHCSTQIEKGALTHIRFSCRLCRSAGLPNCGQAGIFQTLAPSLTVSPLTSKCSESTATPNTHLPSSRHVRGRLLVRILQTRAVLLPRHSWLTTSSHRLTLTAVAVLPITAI